MSFAAEKAKKVQWVAREVAKKLGGSEGNKAGLFADLYMSGVSPMDLTEQDESNFVDEVINIWEFAQHREPNTAKCRAYNMRIGGEGITPNKTVVEIITDNMPFLVDSITSCINSLGFSIHLVTHPVILVKRDEKGHLVSVHSRSDNEPGCSEVSFIRCEINEPSSVNKLELIEKNLTNVLSDVRHAVEDWHAMTGKVYESIASLKTHKINVSDEDLSEVIDFMEWTANHHFTFLGYCEYDFEPNGGSGTKVVSRSPLGILKGETQQGLTSLFEGTKHTSVSEDFFKDAYPLLLAKTTHISPVHRRDPLDSISIKRYDNTGKVVGMVQFFGLFTSVVYNRSPRDIPLLRHKVNRIIERSGFSDQWHDGKALLHILESFPRDELFQSTEDWLFDTSLAILHLQNRQRMSVFVRQDQFDRYVSCLVYTPRDRYDTNLRLKITEVLEKSFHGGLSSWQTQLGELAFARTHFIIKLSEKGTPKYDVAAIEQELTELSLTWRDRLNQLLVMECGEEEGLRLFDRYGSALSPAYQESFDEKVGVADILQMEKAFKSSCLQARLCRGGHEDPEVFQLKLYSTQGSVFLSDVLPVFENLNLRVKGERMFKATPNGKGEVVWIHDFEMTSYDGSPVSIEEIDKPFLETFNHVWCGDIENDGFNRLVAGAGFVWRECQLFRIYAKYLKQLQITFSQAYIEDVLLKNASITQNILKLFYIRFDPGIEGSREKKQQKILDSLASQLERVESLDEDRILNHFINAIVSTLRTNYFQQAKDGVKSYISIKLDSENIDEMPLPRPKYEIFVYSPTMEAVHLRGGKVARGGMRWSDRLEDFRTEILGLVKAQMVKNAVIVPTGSKGGFIVKNLPVHADRETTMNEVVRAYRTMIYGMLDITDNLVKGKIVPPKDVVRWDDDDPYLVVAADKGTATFSDYANEISNEYNFWLGDAFASGGSQGYDHKKMGITARGAWESVKHHFQEMGRDIQTEDTTVIGVGDMSGDVFGNGMLLSKHLKLVAAFNHMHIFVDPNPDPAKSFKERSRLFKLPRSSWIDYDSKLISKGGGVFDRAVKSIVLSPEMKVLLDIQKDKLTPNELIQYILRSEADLLWFGGIGTYVKSRHESNADVGDRVNDMLRVNAGELRCKVIGEGANLAVTQQGRIEYALRCGRLNTDAIDNSAGVDTSDHEVNIKVLFGKLIEQGKIDYTKRNKQLEDMTDEVARLVLKDNIWQNQAISNAQSQGTSILEEQIHFMRDLEAKGILNRTLEYLPDDTELSRRLADKQGLTRPELSVLLAYAKISLSREVIESDLPDSPYLIPKLISYFPKPLRTSLEKSILEHPLRREIVTTTVTNTVVNRMGMTMVNDLERQTGRPAATVVKAYLIARELLDTESLWNEIDSLHGQIGAGALKQITFFAYKRIKRLTKWFLRYGGEDLDIDKALHKYRPPFDELKNGIEQLLSARLRTIYNKRVQTYHGEQINSGFSHRLARLDPLWSAMDIITISQDVGFDVKDVARAYFALGETLNIDWLRESATQISGDTRWQQGASSAVVDDLMSSQKAITLKLLKSVKKVKDLFDAHGKIKQTAIDSTAVDNLMSDLVNVAKLDLPMLTIATRTLRTFAEAS